MSTYRRVSISRAAQLKCRTWPECALLVRNALMGAGFKWRVVPSMVCESPDDVLACLERPFQVTYSRASLTEGPSTVVSQETP